jgi:hypothetical protein
VVTGSVCTKITTLSSFIIEKYTNLFYAPHTRFSIA